MTKIIGHRRNLELLEGQIKNNKISHAYLFLGAPSVGKFTTAMYFAKNLLGSDQDSFHSFEKGIHPDFVIVEKNGKAVPIDKIREIKRSISLLPQLSSRRVVVFEEASLLTLEAQNAFLKTLEEPPAYAVFILISKKENLLPTILSRCTIINFQPVLEKEIKKELIKRGRSEDISTALAHFCLGQIGRVFKDNSFLEKWQEAYTFLKNLSDLTFKEKLDYLKKMEGRMEEKLFFFTSIFRDLFLHQTTPSLLSFLPKSYLNQLNALSDHFDEDQVTRSLKSISFTQNLLPTNINQKLLFENLMIKLKTR